MEFLLLLSLAGRDRSVSYLFFIFFSVSDAILREALEMGRGGSQGETPHGAGASQFLEKDF